MIAAGSALYAYVWADDNDRRPVGDLVMVVGWEPLPGFAAAEYRPVVVRLDADSDGDAGIFSWRGRWRYFSPDLPARGAVLDSIG